MKHERVVLEEQFKKALNLIKDENVKKFTYFALVDYAPLSFWEIPAAFAANCHNECEKAIGHVDTSTGEYVVKEIGGKAWHTLRVVNIAFNILDADDNSIWDFMRRNEKGRFEGSAILPIYADICISACILHDIYSLCEGLDWKEHKHRGMDKEHPFYHRNDLAELASKYLSEDVWSLLLIAIESHMWKWSPRTEHIPRRKNMLNCLTVETAYEFSEMYRVIDTVHIADLLASQREFKGF